MVLNTNILTVAIPRIAIEFDCEASPSPTNPRIFESELLVSVLDITEIPIDAIAPTRRIPTVSKIETNNWIKMNK